MNNSFYRGKLNQYMIFACTYTDINAIRIRIRNPPNKAEFKRNMKACKRADDSLLFTKEIKKNESIMVYDTTATR